MGYQIWQYENIVNYKNNLENEDKNLEDGFGKVFSFLLEKFISMIYNIRTKVRRQYHKPFRVKTADTKRK